MKLYIASDHAGFALKSELVRRPGIEWVDLGPFTSDSVDYPDYAQKLCELVLKENDELGLTLPCGVLICGSGVGISIAANRFKGIRAALVSSPEMAELSRRHNASNILCLGARFVPPADALKILDAWIAAPFEGGRHERRIKKM